jgi:pimeloyl-ACP methyl ester carboxylesterase
MQKEIVTLPNSKIINLSDGRKLGYAEFGNPSGKPLIYFHGHPGSSYEAKFLADEAEKSGIRLIGIDRPGMGQSNYLPNRQIVDCSNDVLELCDNLNIGRFSIVGYSGGGPYALSCVYKIPDRLISCGIIAGVGHTGRMLSFLSMWVPWIMLPIMRQFFREKEQARKLLINTAKNWIEPDRKALQVSGVDEIMASSLVEALYQGAKGAAYDGVLLGRDWGFKIEDITFPSIFLWHGELDNQVPISMGRSVEEKLHKCHATYYPNEGHISLIVNHARDIINAIR